MIRLGILIASLSCALACSSDVTSVDTADAPSLDSALARDVMLAAYEPAYDSVVEDKADPPAPLTLRVLDPRPVDPVKTRSRVLAAIPTPPPAAKTRELQPPTPAAPRAAKTRELQSPPRIRVATLPAGTELAIESGRRICVNTSKVGQSFTARLARALPSRGGITLPRGARITGVVTSLVGRLGEERLEIALRSVTIDGRSYSVSSRVTDIELDRKPGADRCIPDDGRITARLTQPLRITA